MLTSPNCLSLRFACVWEEGGDAPSATQFLAAVRHVSGLECGEPPQQARNVANLGCLSLMVSSSAPVSRNTRAKWARRLESALGGENLAVGITADALASSGPALVVMDADSTLFTGEGIDLVAAQAGTETQVAAITAKAMRGELDFSQSLRERMATLKGLDAAILDEVRENYHLSPGAAEMVNIFHRCGTKVGVVSGGFMELVESKARSIGLDFVLANRFEVQNGKLTGNPQGDIVTGEAKAAALEKWAAELGVSPNQCVAMGDGANDILMVRQAGFGLAYQAKPALREAADGRIPFANLVAAALLTVPSTANTTLSA